MGIRDMFLVRPKSELKELYIFSILFSFASSLILIFEPVFLYQQGISLSAIAAYYALHYTLYIFLLPLGGKFAARFGLERALSFAMPMFVIYFLTLAALPRLPALLWVAWILLALFKMLYWPAYHAEVAKYGDSENRGTELSWLYAVTRGAGVLGPLIGGVVATIFGFPTLFVIAAGLALLATLPLLKTKERYHRVDFPYNAPWQIVKSREHKRIRWGMMGWGENLIDMVFWPIFMFIVLNGVDKLGYVASINVLLMTLLGFFVGEVSDRVPRRKVLRLHLPFMVLGYLFRPFAASGLRVLLTESLSKAAFIGVRIPMWHSLYIRAKRTSPLRYMVAVEMELAIAKAVTAWLLVVVFAVTLPYTGFVAAFILAALLSVMYVWL